MLITQPNEERGNVFPKVPDQHKPNKPMVPNGLGVIYILVSVVYLFVLHFFSVGGATNGMSPVLTLSVCILFGGFLGLLDDWIDLKWRYKAFLPLIAAIPLMSLAWASRPEVRTAISLPFIGTIDFGVYYFFVIIPLLVTIITNTVNQLGGLNGLETICPGIVMVALTALSRSYAVLLIGPLAAWLVLAALNFRGRIFVGNTGSFAIGMTLASFAVISDLKFSLVISILPYVVNSSMILLTFFLFRSKANVSFDGERLVSDHRRSLVTLLTYHHPLTERQVVVAISLIVAASTLAASLVGLF